MNYLAHARNHGSFGAVLRERAAFREAALWLVMSEGLGSFDPTDIRVLASSLWHASGQTSARSGNVLAGLLTDREIGVLDELAKGHANKVIARTLEVTEPTVKFHLQNIYRKLGVNSRKLAIEIATQYGGKSTEMPIQIDDTPIHRVT
ncbi:MAG: LuxR C-terminal-related transcriptional regulator [Pseudomonadota bacterium]